MCKRIDSPERLSCEKRTMQYFIRGTRSRHNGAVSPISKAEATSLLRKAEEENLPVELVGKSANEQAVYMVGFVSVDGDEETIHIYVTGQIAVTVDLEDAQFQYGDPREAPARHQAKAQRIFQFAISVKKTEWDFLIRVWNQPKSDTFR